MPINGKTTIQICFGDFDPKDAKWCGTCIATDRELCQKAANIMIVAFKAKKRWEDCTEEQKKMIEDQLNGNGGKPKGKPKEIVVEQSVSSIEDDLNKDLAELTGNITADVPAKQVEQVSNAPAVTETVAPTKKRGRKPGHKNVEAEQTQMTLAGNLQKVVETTVETVDEKINESVKPIEDTPIQVTVSDIHPIYQEYSDGLQSIAKVLLEINNTLKEMIKLPSANIVLSEGSSISSESISARPIDTDTVKIASGKKRGPKPGSKRTKKVKK